MAMGMTVTHPLSPLFRLHLLLLFSTKNFMINSQFKNEEQIEQKQDCQDEGKCCFSIYCASEIYPKRSAT